MNPDNKSEPLFICHDCESETDNEDDWTDYEEEEMLSPQEEDEKNEPTGCIEQFLTEL